jgi:hypothetical protein
MHQNTSDTISFPIEEPMAEFAAIAITRLSYLFPAIRFSKSDSAIVAESDDKLPATIGQEIAYALYREKIYCNTLEIRRSLYSRILGL